MDNDILKALRLQKSISEYRDDLYLSTIQRMQEESARILKPQLGNAFVANCARDLAGEVVRNFFNTSDYHITVDQMATRILKFEYENEYDPIGNNSELHKNVLYQNDMSPDTKDFIAGEINAHLGTNFHFPESTLDSIHADLEKNQHKLFEIERDKDYSDKKARDSFRRSKVDANGDLFDDYTGEKGGHKSVLRNGKTILVSNLQADHVQSREAATYNAKLIKAQGVEELRQFINSADNMKLMHESANTSKGDVRVCKVDGKIVYKNTKDSDYVKSTDITHKATPKQLAEATCKQWEKDSDPEKIQKLKNNGYLNDDGKVPESIRKKLEDNIRHSQNKESSIILKNTKYDTVAKDAAASTKKNIGKIVAGQVIYYAVPPIVYELRKILCDGATKLDNAISRLAESGKRICNYVFSHLKDIFKSVAENSLKTFLKTFMDTLINMVKASVKKLLKIAKSLVMSVVDAIKIVTSPNTSGAQKADSVFTLFGVTITNIVLELLFEAIEDGLGIPEFLLSPLQILTSIICTNLVMLILEKADIFNVHLGFKMTALEEMFERERENYNRQYEEYNQTTQEEIADLLQKLKDDCQNISDSLKNFDPYEDSAREILEDVNRIFNMNIDFEAEWQSFLGRPAVETTA